MAIAGGCDLGLEVKVVTTSFASVSSAMLQFGGGGRGCEVANELKQVFIDCKVSLSFRVTLCRCRNKQRQFRLHSRLKGSGG
jgi:hypothetical protein